MFILHLVLIAEYFAHVGVHYLNSSNEIPALCKKSPIIVYFHDESSFIPFFSFKQILYFAEPFFVFLTSLIELIRRKRFTLYTTFCNCDDLTFRFSSFPYFKKLLNNLSLRISLCTSWTALLMETTALTWKLASFLPFAAISLLDFRISFILFCLFGSFSGVRWFKMMEEFTKDNFERWIADLARPSIEWVESVDEYLEKRDEFPLTAFSIVSNGSFNGMFL